MTNMNKQTIRPLFLVALGALLITACKKEFDSPPVPSIPEGSVLTVQELRDLFQGNEVRFDSSMSVYGVITADETSGNLFRNVYMQDHTGAINLRLATSGGVYQGDSIRVHLPGTVLSSYNGMLQLDSVDVDNNIIKQAVNIEKEPELVSIADINSSLQARLIRMEQVEFAVSEIGQTYSDPINQSTVNRTLVDCNNDQIIVRTSGYANFAGMDIPLYNGEFVAIVGEYQGTMQLYIRDINEIKLTGARCDSMSVTVCPPAASLNQSFDNVTDNVDYDEMCWRNVATVGSRVWRGDEFSGDLRLQATAFGSFDATNTMWLVSPNMQFTPGMELSFSTQQAFYTHDPFDVFISTDFNGFNITSATWNTINATEATVTDPANTWIPSGAIPLDGYVPMGYTGNFYIGFRYTGSGPSNQTTSYRIDDIVIQ